MHTMAKFFLEVVLHDHLFLQYPSSLQAAAVTYLTIKIFESPNINWVGGYLCYSMFNYVVKRTYVHTCSK